MKPLVISTCLLLTLVTLAYGSASGQPVNGPAAVVSALYKAHDSKNTRLDPFFQRRSRALVDKYFTRSLGNLIWKDAITTPKGEEGAIGADPLYNAQDEEIKNFAVGRAAIDGNAATVPVTFTNFGNKVKISFKLKLVKGGWKIDDIVYGGEAGSLRQWFKETSDAKPSAHHSH